MSGGGSANNSWTILTPEETVAETLRPLAEGTEHHEESLTSAAGSGVDQLTEASPVEGHLVSEEQSGDTSTEQHTSVPTTITDQSVPTSFEASGTFVPGSDVLSQSKGLPEGPAESSPDPDSFSDSYTRITPSSDEPPASLLSTETLEGVEFKQEEERLSEEGTLHLVNGEELQQEGEGSDLSSKTTDLGKQADSPVDSELLDESTEKTEGGEEAEVRRRSLLAALERIGRTEEEEEAEEDFQLPRRGEDSGFSVNKCILGAVILLGLGTIFFSGFFMDLDEESEYGTRELKDSEVQGKQEWLNSDVPTPPVDADNTEIQKKLAEGNQQILALQVQLQAQKEELKVARGQAAEEAKEWLRWEEVEKENSRLKTEMASLPVLQKENERMKRELESVPGLQKELETLRSIVTELRLPSAASEATQESLKPTASPPSGQPKDTRQGSTGTAEKQAKKAWDEQKDKKKEWKKNKYDIGEKKDWKGREEKSEWKEDGEKRSRKDVGKTEWKMEKHEQGKSDKEKDKERKQKKHGDETKQWKKEKASKGDEGKPWKARDGNKEWIEKSESKELNEGKDWKKAKHEKGNDGKQWRNKEERKDLKGGNDHEERHRVKEEWKGEKEWKKVKDGFKESGKEKWERKDWKEKGEKKEWKKNGKDQGKEGKGKGERKQWKEGENRDKSPGNERRGKDERKQWSENKGNSKNGKNDKEWKRKDEKKRWEKKEEEWKRDGEKEKMHGDWKKDSSSFQKHKAEHTFISNHHHDHHEEHVWGDRKSPHTHSRPSLEQPEYWDQQRDRLQHNPNPPQHCSSLETCAQTEGLLPVTLPEFEAILQTYLAKAEEAGVDAFVREELKKLTTEFFKDGVFVHDQMSFQDFVEDISDILEHMVEGNENGEEDSAIEEEMEEFEKEVMKKFSVPAAGEKEVRIKGEWKKESGRGRG